MLPEADDVRDTGSLRGDLIAVLGDAAAQLAGPAGAGMRGILSDALGDPAAADELRARRKGRGAAVMRESSRRAVARGELASADDPPARVLEVGHAMLRHEFLFTGTRDRRVRRDAGGRRAAAAAVARTAPPRAVARRPPALGPLRSTAWTPSTFSRSPRRQPRRIR